jgi:Peptidase propeptide and YPEB domain
MSIKTKGLLTWMATATAARMPMTLLTGAAMYSINRLRLALGFAAILGMASNAFAIDSTLQSQAKISKSAAEKIAHSKVPTGTIQNAELEKERGKLIWSFDISKPRTKNITEVQIDARSGRILSVRIETPAAQVKERKSES